MSFLPHQSTPQLAQFTCNTCGVRFVVADLQRQHMKTEWHRYNLKRRVAQLPLISLEVFAEKVLEREQQESDGEDEFGYPRRRSRGVRQLTKKDLKMQERGRRAELEPDFVRDSSPATSVASGLSLFSLGDSVHLSEADTAETGSEINYSDASESWHSESETSDAESVESTQFDEVPTTQCFYCGKNNTELENNVRHLSHAHGLYIPERTYLADLNGLLAFLGEVVSLDHDCLVCGFHGLLVESIRLHLVSKGHCKVPYETPDEKLMVAEFYDFSHKETHSTTLPEVAVAISGEKSAKKVSFAQTDCITLPSGSKVGHRSVVRYHRATVRDPAESSKTVALVDRRFAPGMDKFLVAKQEREVHRITNREASRHVRRDKTRKANYQPHFRDEILGT